MSWRPISGQVSRHLVSAGNLVQGSEGGRDIADLDRLARSDLHLFRRRRGDLTSATTGSGSRASGPSSRDTPNPVQVTLTGEAKPSHDGKMDFLDNRSTTRPARCAAAPSSRTRICRFFPGSSRVRLIGSAPYEALLLPDTAIATDQSRKIRFRGQRTTIRWRRSRVTLGPLDDACA
jgi:hypothetical protein